MRFMLDVIIKHLQLSPEEIHHHPEYLINAFDRNHTILLWNKNCEKYFCIPAEQAVGKKLEDIMPWLRGHEKMSHLERALSGRPVHVLNDTYHLKNAFYEQKVIPVKDDGGNIVAAVNMVRTL
jgi:transcriptional regulator with PAS, ATPase and Fis domain